MLGNYGRIRAVRGRGKGIAKKVCRIVRMNISKGMLNIRNYIRCRM
jgi:hypothetical protein